jgi:hypothetical protein
MRFFQALFALFFAFSMFTACQQEKKEPIDELEEFVIQVEHSVEDGEIKQWSEVEQEFYQQWEGVKSSTEDAGEELESEMNQLKSRFESAKSNWKNSKE